MEAAPALIIITAEVMMTLMEEAVTMEAADMTVAAPEADLEEAITAGVAQEVEVEAATAAVEAEVEMEEAVAAVAAINS